MNIYAKTDIGLERAENQDNVWGEMLGARACAAVLCDGMGGESRGGLRAGLPWTLFLGEFWKITGKIWEEIP